MKRIVLVVSMAAISAVASAQTPAKPASSSSQATKTSATARPATAGVKLPPGVPRVKGVVKALFSLQYEDSKIGAGAVAEPGKMYKVNYTGYLTATGVKFDATDLHRMPVMGKDGKPVLGDDGKPKLGDPQPYQFVQGMGGRGPFPGFDQGFEGMKIGGKRRLFVPWELAYGTHAIPERGPDHPAIPAKSDMIFDVELVDVTDAPAPPTRPGMGVAPGARPMPGVIPPHPGAPVPPGQPGAAPATPAKPGTTPANSAPAGLTGQTPPQAPATPGATAAPAQPASPATTAQPAAPATPAQPQPK